MQSGVYANFAQMHCNTTPTNNLLDPGQKGQHKNTGTFTQHQALYWNVQFIADTSATAIITLK